MSKKKNRKIFFPETDPFKKLRWVIAGFGILLICLWLFTKPLTMLLLKQVVHHRLSILAYPFEDGLHAGLCGTGSPLADVNRVGPCIAVVAGKHLYIVDSGDGSTRNITLMGFQTGKIDAVLLTHFHSDHIAGLGEVMLQRWAGGSNKTPLEIFGPEGVEKVVKGFNDAYSLDKNYRIAHHGAKDFPSSGAGGVARRFKLGPEEDASTVIVNKDGLKITAFKVNHKPVVPAVGYRFDYKGRSLVISGDTTYSASLLKHSQGVDVLFHEVISPWMVEMIHDQADVSPVPSLKRVTADIVRYHASPEDVARIATGACVKELVFYHVIPPLPSSLLNSLFLEGAEDLYNGPITMGVDGMLFSLPADSQEINRKTIL
jgi:ribonuclease Z